jgi:hypothetical protein
VSSNVDGGLQWPAKISPYRHGVAVYGGNMANIIGVAAYVGWHKIRHTITWWYWHGGNLTTQQMGL